MYADEYPREPNWGLNPEFVKRVQEKRRIEAMKARTVEVTPEQVEAVQAEYAAIVAKVDAARAKLDEIRKATKEAILAGIEATGSGDFSVAGTTRPRVKNPRTINSIVETFARRFSLTREEITGTARNRDLVLLRQAIIYWCVRRTNRSLTQIGIALKRDRATVVHSTRQYVAKRAHRGRKL